MKTKLIALAVLGVLGVTWAAEVPLVTVCRVRRGVVFEDTAFAQGTVRTKESATIAARVPGTIDELLVAEGATVKKGDVLMVLEAMKMENEIMCPRDGVVSSVQAAKGAAVESGTLLCVLQ